MISLRQKQNAEALLGASWPLSWPDVRVSPDEKQSVVLLPFYMRKSKWQNVGWHGRGLISILQIKECVQEQKKHNFFISHWL